MGINIITETAANDEAESSAGNGRTDARTTVKGAMVSRGEMESLRMVGSSRRRARVSAGMSAEGSRREPRRRLRRRRELGELRALGVERVHEGRPDGVRLGVLGVGDRLFFTFGYRALAEQPIGAVPEMMTGMMRR